MGVDKTEVDDRRVRKYISLAEARLAKAIDAEADRHTIEKARRYLSDGKHYLERGDSATALASVCYAHGLLDGATVTSPRQRHEPREIQILARIFVNELDGKPSLARLTSAFPMDEACIQDTLEKLLEEGAIRRKDDELCLTSGGRSRIRVGLVAGVFDLIHPGHLAFLRWAKEHVDVLTAVIARDPSSKVRKGREPIQRESDRLSLVSAMKPVDYAMLGDREDIYSSVLKIRPDVILLGKDQEADGRHIRADLARKSLKVKVIRSRVWDSGELSKTTKIVDRVAETLRIGKAGR